MRETQTNLAGDLLLNLGQPGDGPLHERVKRALRTAIRQGRIEIGTALPPSRQLAADLGCSRWAVTEAYSQLVAEGYLEARTGSATRVRWSNDDHADSRRPAPHQASVARFDLAPGLPDLRAFPRRRWAEAVRAQATTMAFTEFGYPPSGGHPRLRRLLAEYLGRSRGVSAAPQDVTVCTSVTDGVRRVCHALRAHGITAVGCEEPGWTRLREVVGAAGLETVPIRTDGGGLRTDDLARHTGLRAVLTTPAHQFPLGTVLVPERRAALLRWARHVDGVVLEDDYDAEFRYDRRPVAAVQGMDPSRVVLFKSLSKILSPALGIGWIVAPPRWTDHLHHTDQAATQPSTVDQLAFAALLESGAYDRHLRACRQRYRRRRDALVQALAEQLPDASVSGIAAGLHLILRLPTTVGTAAVVTAAASRSLRVADLTAYHATDDHTDHGLVLGYGNLADSMVNEAVRHLREAIESSGFTPRV
ncbi:PLP-dependent aminotransferase family protein [Streptomyces europaeiscabiei]|uniref:PLP-dependent aminotransferase family protein n=1 Tax=Streptomyces europaeiscabiei TaxID=146819 RepID=A0ABU4NHC3_9ACTN|nr:PLP-dependent aminotransferase family protein [Streptomyces europaeiscabiei]MDX2772751.1 PLP-dependent aminotransferase family protein [Streptomyces europaeiscabiei]MDX3544554.1 PLP-dependent aminotransferase family protein [Streptomyces europaeiscabiei]MDX3553903.1 PLP-dependent aminotransferase family protein [Streptomyces europaeiscabiei]MDX3670186.1 PLP-dependent aminotransferase family protein [Streptomyces europaeiscabiei]MDX3702021.1 PLP-dependent aminotransferase family protein [Str